MFLLATGFEHSSDQVGEAVDGDDSFEEEFKALEELVCILFENVRDLVDEEGYLGLVEPF